MTIMTTLLVWRLFALRALALSLAAVLHPGAEVYAAPFLEAAADAVNADPNPLGGASRELATMLVFAEDETAFGKALAGRRYDPLAFGVLQVRGPRRLETDHAASARWWLVKLHAAARLCGDARATAGLSSGRCDRAVKLAAGREREAAVALESVARDVAAE